MEKTPTHIRVNGHLYRRADEGPEAEGAIPEPMSPEAVLAADFGIPPDQVEDLKGIKDQSGVSIYDIIKMKRK